MIQQEILLIRHTSVAYPRGFCYGDLDIDVSTDFNTEAAWLKNQIKDFEHSWNFGPNKSNFKKVIDVVKYIKKKKNFE